MIRIYRSPKFLRTRFNNTLRVALTGSPDGPSIGFICEILGKEETMRRLKDALNSGIGSGREEHAERILEPSRP